MHAAAWSTVWKKVRRGQANVSDFCDGLLHVCAGRIHRIFNEESLSSREKYQLLVASESEISRLALMACKILNADNKLDDAGRSAIANAEDRCIDMIGDARIRVCRVPPKPGGGAASPAKDGPECRSADDMLRIDARERNQSSQSEDGQPHRRHGFPAAAEHHRAIADTVEKHFPNWRGSNKWRREGTLSIICHDLDSAEIPIPKNWRMGKTEALKGARARTWTDALRISATGSKLVADQIRTSLDHVKGWRNA